MGEKKLKCWIVNFFKFSQSKLLLQCTFISSVRLTTLNFNSSQIECQNDVTGKSGNVEINNSLKVVSSRVNIQLYQMSLRATTQTESYNLYW